MSVWDVFRRPVLPVGAAASGIDWTEERPTMARVGKWEIKLEPCRLSSEWKYVVETRARNTTSVAMVLGYGKSYESARAEAERVASMLVESDL